MSEDPVKPIIIPSHIGFPVIVPWTPFVGAERLDPAAEERSVAAEEAVERPTEVDIAAGIAHARALRSAAIRSAGRALARRLLRR